MSPEPPPAPRPSRRTRHRYVLVRVRTPPGPPRPEFVRRLRALPSPVPGWNWEERAWLTRYDGAHGVIRCRRGDERTLAAALSAATSLEVETVSTSGTIAALERRYRSLHLPGNRA